MKKVSYKIKLLLIAFVSVVVLSLVLLGVNDSESKTTIELLPATGKIKIAACPTCFKASEKLNEEKYQVIPTASTAESADLLNKGEVDMILAGRTLRPNETEADSLVLTEGYSFLAAKPQTVYIDEIKRSVIYTDIDASELKQELPDFIFKKVDDVYLYLGKGRIVLTTWENTDYLRAEIVHVIDRDGQRLAKSRRPTLYCPTKCDLKIADDIKLVFDYKNL